MRVKWELPRSQDVQSDRYNPVLIKNGNIVEYNYDKLCYNIDRACLLNRSPVLAMNLKSNRSGL